MSRDGDGGVLVSWVSIGFAAAPLLSVFADRASRLRGRISDVYLCHRVAPNGGERERAALEATVAQIEAAPADVRPTLHLRAWQTTASPTAHDPIRAFAEGVLREVRERHPDAGVYLHLSPGTPAMHAVWLLLGATGVVEPPLALLETRGERDRAQGEDPVREVRIDVDTWLRRVRELPRPASPELTDDTLWDPAHVRSPAARAVLERVDRWAPLPAPMMLLGERGTGKTTLAHVIRARSRFCRLSDERWPVVVCGQFRANPDLARAELFGYAKGAFTGADRARAGLLEEADGDTVFLDEIGDIDATTQRLLIAAVERRGFQRMGDATLRKPAFRLIAATNRPLATLRGETLDEDFFDRLSTFTLRLPALRERREDLPTLWRSAVSRVARELGVGRSFDGLAHDRRVLERLAGHPLPGNLRDLQRAAWHGAAVLQAHAGLELAASAAMEALDEEGVDPPAAETADSLPLDLDAVLGATERRWLETAMQAAAGNKTRAAALLGLRRKTFDYRWQKLADA